jgi:hypothetical protein
VSRKSEQGDRSDLVDWLNGLYDMSKGAEIYCNFLFFLYINLVPFVWNSNFFLKFNQLDFLYRTGEEDMLQCTGVLAGRDDARLDS